MANNIKKRAERNGKIRSAISQIEQTVAKLERLKDEYLEKAIAAKAHGETASYNLCKSALNTTLTQIKRAKEMLLNIEITAELQKMGETNADFLTAMSTVAKRISKINKKSDFVKLQKEIQKALNGMEEAQAGLDTFLNSADAHFATISKAQGALSDSQIDALVSGNVTERELLVDARIAAVMAEEQIEEVTAKQERIAQLDGDDQSATVTAKPFPSPRGAFDFAPKKSQNVSLEILGDDGELPLKTVIKREDEPTVVVGRTKTGDIKRVELDAPLFVCGRKAGSGKITFINSALCSLLCTYNAEELKLVLFDLENTLCAYNGIPHMAADAITSPQEIRPALKLIIQEIARRRSMEKPNKLPYIVVVLDGVEAGEADELFSASDVGVFTIVTAQSAVSDATVVDTDVSDGEVVLVIGDERAECIPPCVSDGAVARLIGALGGNVL